MTTTAQYRVNGMTCEHCVKAVTSELTSLAGVREVTVDLSPAGTSTVTLHSDRPLDAAAVAAAVDEAGYTLAEAS